MSATELLQQVKALPPAEQRKFFDRVHRLEEKVAAPPKRKPRRVRWPNMAARRRKIFGNKVLPNIVLMAREEERY